MKSKKKDLDYAVKVGVANSAMIGSGENYLSPYAIALGASDVQVGMLASIPQLIGSLSQLFSTKITEKMGSRRKMVLVFSLIESLIWIPIGLLAFSGYNVVWNLILFATVYWISASIVVPAWTSWLGDLVPDKRKGRFFGKRRRAAGLSLFVSILIAGLILFFSAKYHPLVGFGIIFLIAFVSKLISLTYLKRTTEPAFYVEEESRFTFLDFVKKMTKTNFGKFVIYLALITFSVNISGPYFAVYMLKDMGLDYLTYTIIISASKISSFVFIAVWGKYSDFFGNKRVMTLTGYMLFIMPFLWILSTNVFYLICVQILSGFIWSGFNISTFNFIFDTVSPSKRVRCVSYCNVFNGLAIFLGASFGGWLLKFGSMFWSNFILLLIASGTGRLLSSFVMLPEIKEVRWVKKASERKLLMSITSDVFEGLTYPVLFLYNKRLVAKSKGEMIIRKISKFIGRILGKKHKYS